MLIDDPIFDTAETEEDALFLMANLHPKETGLPRVIYVSERGAARHDARVKVSGVPGERMSIRDMATFAVRPEPRLIHGRLDRDEERVIGGWILRNQAALIAYWNDEISTTEMLGRLVHEGQ